ncbi:Glycosyl hydrolases family 43 [Planctomycetes bacterium CA13]|uniref:Glycosyl hydrolases family 43 n=1 Tax=Novipirellula herctigrandis TaxID=2527986 RepID=A0A5C5Z4L7_9BACT|nr:Glycosyl hydrolases family 43 [Planctomycetes bacterium CA13]
MTSTLRAIAILFLLSGVSGAQDRSEAFRRYAASDLEFELENTFFPKFNHKLVTGLGYNADPAQDPLVQKKVAVYRKDPKTVYHVRLHHPHQELQAAHHLRHALDGFVENTTFRDPTSPIRVGDTYHIWYSKSWGTPPVGQESGSQEAWQDIKGKWKRIYSWDFVSIWHATSKDGYHWQEQGVALEPGPAGSYDDRCVFTPDVLVANGKYYLYYQVATSPHVYKEGPHKIAFAWADSPQGPWHKSKQPILAPSEPGHFDSAKVHDPCLIVKGGKYYLYYKGHGADTQYGEPFHIGWGVAIADRPEGPFVKSKLNPVVCGGHEVMIFPYQSGVVGFVRQGPELYSMQYAEDGLNFRLVSHVTEVPHAGAFFRKGHFKDIDKHPAEFPKWGLAHDYRLGSGEAFLVRFDLSFPATTEQLKGLSQ